MSYSERSEDLSPVVTYRHTRIIALSSWLNQINGMLKTLYHMQAETKYQKDLSPDLSIHLTNETVNLKRSSFGPYNSEFRKESYLVMCDVIKGILSGIITFLEAEREGLIREYNRLETAKPDTDVNKIQDTKQA